MMSCWTKEELENMLEDVINVLELSDDMILRHGQLGTPSSKLVRMVLEEKDNRIRLLATGFVNINSEGR